MISAKTFPCVHQTPHYRVASSGIMSHLVDMATSCLSLQQKDAQSSSIKFIDLVLHRATIDKCIPCLEQIKRKGQDMVNNCL